MSENDDVISLQLIDSGVTLSTWISYYFNSHFLTPTDGFHFTIAHELVPDNIRAALVPGASVQLRINGQLQSSGYIDTVTYAQEREGGTEITIEGRDSIAPAVDANMDPRVRFAQGTTLIDLLETVFIPFGFADFEVDDDANRGVITGQLRGTKSSHGKKNYGQTLKKTKLHQLKPHENEGAFAFASRITQRHGLWIWPSADGLALVVSRPDFDVETIAAIRRTRTGSSNSIAGIVKRSMESQPSVIIAQGFGGGGEFPRTKMTAYAIHPGLLDGSVRQLLQEYPDAQPVDMGAYYFPPITSTFPRPVFLHDDESKTPEQLANYVRRELSLHVRKSFEASYVMQGHTFVDSNGDRIPWCVNTMVDVQDDIAGITEPLWVMSRTFTKNRSSGTTTQLELIRPHTLTF